MISGGGLVLDGRQVEFVYETARLFGHLAVLRAVSGRGHYLGQALYGVDAGTVWSVRLVEAARLLVPLAVSRAVSGRGHCLGEARVILEVLYGEDDWTVW